MFSLSCAYVRCSPAVSDPFTVCGELEILDLLLEAGANPSTPDIHGAYPVHYAAQMCGPNSGKYRPACSVHCIMHHVL